MNFGGSANSDSSPACDFQELHPDPVATPRDNRGRLRSIPSQPSAAGEFDGAVVRVFARDERIIRGYIIRLLGNSSQADDIFQETYLRVIEKSRSVVIHEPLAYIYRTARNLISDMYKSASRTSGELSDELPSDLPTPEESIDAQQRLKLFVAQVEKMPGLRREVFLRRRLHGHSYRQIGEDLGLSLKAVEKHISRALASLNESRLMEKRSQWRG